MARSKQQKPNVGKPALALVGAGPLQGEVIPAPPKQPRAKKGGGDWRPGFLNAFKNSGNIRASCAAAGISRAEAYRVRDEDATFREQWDQAREDAIDTLEASAWQIARQPHGQYILWKLLQANRRALYGDRIGLGGGPDASGPIRLVVVYEEGPPEGDA